MTLEGDTSAGAASRLAGDGATVAAPTWWRRPGLDVIDGRLSVNGADLEALARERGTPLFVYDLARPVENIPYTYYQELASNPYVDIAIPI